MAVAILVSLAVGFIVGFVVGFLVYRNNVKTLKADEATLTSKISALEDRIEELLGVKPAPAPTAAPVPVKPVTAPVKPVAVTPVTAKPVAAPTVAPVVTPPATAAPVK